MWFKSENKASLEKVLVLRQAIDKVNVCVIQNSRSMVELPWNVWKCSNPSLFAVSFPRSPRKVNIQELATRTSFILLFAFDLTSINPSLLVLNHLDLML